jgi:hypothetical protein
MTLTDDPVPDYEYGEGEAAADSCAPPMARCACDCNGLAKISDVCDNPGSKSGAMLFHATSVLSRRPPNALSLFKCFALFVQFNRWRGYDHSDDPSWRGTSSRGAGEVPMRRAGTVGAGAGAGAVTIGMGSEGAGTEGGLTQPQLAERTAWSNAMVSEEG